MTDRLKLAAKTLGYAGAICLALDVAWAAGAAHIPGIPNHQYTGGLVLLFALASLCLLAATILTGFDVVNSQSWRRAEVALATNDRHESARNIRYERLEETLAALATELVTIHALSTAVHNSVGSIPEVGRLLLAVQAAVGGLTNDLRVLCKGQEMHRSAQCDVIEILRRLVKASEAGEETRAEITERVDRLETELAHAIVDGLHLVRGSNVTPLRPRSSHTGNT